MPFLSNTSSLHNFLIQTSEYDVYSRQFLTTKVDTRAVSLGLIKQETATLCHMELFLIEALNSLISYIFNQVTDLMWDYKQI